MAQLQDAFSGPAPDPLSALRDIHLPEAVAFWPPAPGWWVVAGALLLALCLGWAWWRRRRRSVRRLALRELDLLQRDFQERDCLDDLAAGLSILMRRVSLLRFGTREPNSGTACRRSSSSTARAWSWCCRRCGARGIRCQRRRRRFTS